MRAVGLVYPGAGLDDLMALLPLEMWTRVRRAAGLADRFEICLWGAQAHLPQVQALAASLEMQVDAWHDLSCSTDDCRVAMDWLRSRGGEGPEAWIPNTMITWWTRTGPRPTLKFLVALGLTLPDVIASSHAWRRAIVCDLGHSRALRRPWAFLHQPLSDGTGTGRHSLRAWQAARGAQGCRLLALWARPERRYVQVETLATFDARLGKLARLRHTAKRSDRPLAFEACVALANAIALGDPLPIFWRWLNAAVSRADAGEPVDFALAEVLGVAPIKAPRVVP